MSATHNNTKPPVPKFSNSGSTRRYATLRTIIALILREMSTRYGRSPGGYVWAVLEPLAAIIVLAVALSLIIRNPPLGTSFILFYATGFLPFSLYQNLSLTISRAIVFSKALLFYPVVTWLDAILARFILNSLTGVMVAYLLLIILLNLTETRTVLEIGPIVSGIALSMLLGLSVGTLNCAFLGLFPTWDVIWSVITRPLFLASGILFIYEDLPTVAQNILWYNPLMHISGLFRSGFYPMYNPIYVSELYVIMSSLIALALGLLLLGRYHNDILNN
ncbi:ABC transporter permease [Parasulfitobacter algicola]|uniref:Transport permease protein n=1 Tax=Parasulfitobacter algicola TaxID=2614809 RepID=A0ABX2ILY9_9RHOB|nr:ABC transporter permease [Sulfitobacter algicola]NSX53898.1 ABC transporter permease [Sulfitobacter algicola]